jgi:hypothetical protein
MHRQKLFYILLVWLVFAVVLFSTAGCYKEYSYEGGGNSVIIVKDTVPALVKGFPDCALCKATDNLKPGTWNFKTGNSYLCGGVTNAGFIGDKNDKTTFTFFGPSACSVDTGLVMTVYLPVIFDRDRFNVITSITALYYYDNNAPKDIFISLPPTPLWLTVESYFHETGIATGTFYGTVFKPNGDSASITDGKFMIKLK